MNLLFLCVANSARSQMAEGLARELFGSHINVQSAGSKPTQINPHAVRVMAEVGIDISGQRSKSIDSINFSGTDIVITLCDEEACIVLPDKVKHLHWPVLDPIGKGSNDEEHLKHFREARDIIQKKIHGLAQLIIPS